MDEMRDVAPEVAVIRIEFQRRAKALLLHAEPDFAQTIRRQLALAPRGMHLPLEFEEGDLPNHRVEHVFDLGGQHQLAPPRPGLVQQIGRASCRERGCQYGWISGGADSIK